MSRLNRIYSQLSKQKQVKKTRKTHLNAIDKMRNLSGLMDRGVSTAEEFFDTLAKANYDHQIAVENAEDVMSNSPVEYLQGLIDEAYEVTELVEKKYKELGLSTDEAPQYDEVLRYISDLEDAISNIEDEYNTSDFQSLGFSLK